MQRQLVSLLRELGPDILIATHSTEIIAECDPTSLLYINKKNASAHRVKDVSQLKRVFSALGSNLNPTLTQLAKTRRVVFVEGLDFQILSIFARILGNQKVANRGDFAVVQMDGFNPKRAVDLASGIDVTIGSPVLRAVVLDRDYRSEAEIEDVRKELTKHGFLVHIHGRKELENYLLESEVLARAIDTRLSERARRLGEDKKLPPDSVTLIDQAMSEVKHDVFAQIQARESDYRRKKNPGLDPATITAEVSKRFEDLWATHDGRLALVPGKDVLARINLSLQKSAGVSVSDRQIAGQFRESEVPSDIRNLIDALTDFVVTVPSD